LNIVGKTTKNQPQIEPALDGVRKFKKAFNRERRRRRREDRRHLTVEWIGGIFAFVGINGSIVILLHQTGIIELLIDEWGLGHTLSGLIIGALWIGFAFLLISTFFWLSDKTGLHFFIEDWVVSWDTWDTSQSHNIHKYKKFPRKKRRTLIRDLKKELDVFTAQLYRLEEEAYDIDDEKLSDSVESINQVIGNLVTEVDYSSPSLILQLDRASWKGFALTLEETSNDLKLELQDIAKYHKKVQPFLEQASNLIAKVIYRIIDSDTRGKEATITE
jgi:hypothetical protein